MPKVPHEMSDISRVTLNVSITGVDGPLLYVMCPRCGEELLRRSFRVAPLEMSALLTIIAQHVGREL